MPTERNVAAQVAALRGESDLLVAFAGNPNVGKSSVFNRLTGLSVATANYPGKTVALNLGQTILDGLRIGLLDLPGCYSLGAVSEDQWVARQALLETRADAVVAVVDATNLARNLYLVLQLQDLGLPVVVALNLLDEARRSGSQTDLAKLSDLLAGPVVGTVAVSGEGIEPLLRAAVALARDTGRPRTAPAYGRDVSDAISDVADSLDAVCGELPYRLSQRAVAVLLLEADTGIAHAVGALAQGASALARSQEVSNVVEAAHGEPMPIRLARERHGLAGAIASQVQSFEDRRARPIERLWRYTTHPVAGIPLLLFVLAAVFAVLFYVGALLSGLISHFWGAVVSPPVQSLVFAVFGDGALGRTLLWGPDAGLASALSVAVPYVLVFYIILGLLEDTGYLGSAAFLADRAMHRLGLHSQALIPLVAGAGCSVPAIIGTRVLASKRERFIAGTLISLIPCSARTAVILGSVSLYVGWQAALVVFGVVIGVAALVGVGLNRVLPGASAGLVMEVFPFRRPSLRSIARKTWVRFREFLYIAAPIVFVGSLVLGALYETGLVWSLSAPLAPVVEGWLGLPPVAGLALIFAVLRKELALQLLIAFAVVLYGRAGDNLLHFMSPSQIVTYALVNTLYIPCAASLPVLARELGWRRTALIVALTLTIALLIGAASYRVSGLLGWGA